MFRTEIEDQQFEANLSYQSKMLTIGSCFSDTIGNRLRSSKFNVLVNPFGTIFNPLSIFELLELSLERSEVLELATLKRDGYYMNYKFHSDFRAKTKDTLHKRMDATLNQVAERLKAADFLFITLGTAWIYEQKTTEMLVANCHKTPRKEFNKRLLSVEEIVAAFFSWKELIGQFNPSLQIIITVSPVRHTRDTLQLNAVSKSVLRLAAHYMQEMVPKVHYFPAYEIMMDDLRDYRFYEKDMIHPNEQAIDYIWEKFIDGLLNPEDAKTLASWMKVKQSLEHRAFNPKSNKHQQFLANTLNQLEQLKSKLPVQEEIKQLKNQLA